MPESCHIDDLDTVQSRYGLDVSIVKDKLAVRQKGKRATAALQHKLQNIPQVWCYIANYNLI